MAVIGEVLWDIFDESRRLGGAPLNFAAHSRRLGYNPVLISAVGADSLGREALAFIEALDLDTSFLQRTDRYPTGSARVQLGPDGNTRFVIERPAAYDDIRISESHLESLARIAPEWLYFGTLFASTSEGTSALNRVLEALPSATRFYDLNLRPGFASAPLLERLLSQANVIKLNEEELQTVHELTGLPLAYEPFCRAGVERYGWRAVCVTLGAHGCALLVSGEYAEARGHAVDVVDTVGAGDAFAAAFLHGLIRQWSARDIAVFGNRIGALVASRHGAIPDWTLQEAVEL